MLHSQARFGGNALGLPAPIPLPNLRDALARRSAIFGPVDPDEMPVRQLGLRHCLCAVLRGMANLLEPAQVVM